MCVQPYVGVEECSCEFRPGHVAPVRDVLLFALCGKPLSWPGYERFTAILGYTMGRCTFSSGLALDPSVRAVQVHKASLLKRETAAMSTRVTRAVNR